MLFPGQPNRASNQGSSDDPREGVLPPAPPQDSPDATERELGLHAGQALPISRELVDKLKACRERAHNAADWLSEALTYQVKLMLVHSCQGNDPANNHSDSSAKTDDLHQSLNKALQEARSELSPYKDLFTRWVFDSKYSALACALWPLTPDALPAGNTSDLPLTTLQPREGVQRSTETTAETSHESHGPFELVEIMSRFCGWQLSTENPATSTTPAIDLAQQLTRREISMIHEAALQLTDWANRNLPPDADDCLPESASKQDPEKNRAG